MAAQADARLITPSLPRALAPSAREKVESAIERHLDAATALTSFLDAADGDADFEPSLGSQLCVGYCGDMGASPARTWDQTCWGAGVTDDREDECEDEGADEHYRCGGAL